MNSNKIIDISFINTIFYREFPCNFIFEGEKHDFWELVFMDSGEMTVVADDKTIILKKDCVIFHKPNEFHALSTGSEIAPNAIVISFHTDSKMMKLFENQMFKLTKENKITFGKFLKEAKAVKSKLGTFSTLEEDYHENVFGSYQSMYNLLELLLIEIYRSNSSEPLLVKSNESLKVDSFVIASIVEYLTENVNNKITFEDVHKKFYYSKTQLKVKFKKEMGISIVAYFNKLKIEKAKVLIREGKYNFTQISSILGFETVHYFSKVFKKINKMTPTEYGRSVKSISDE